MDELAIISQQLRFATILHNPKLQYSLYSKFLRIICFHDYKLIVDFKCDLEETEPTSIVFEIEGKFSFIWSLARSTTADLDKNFARWALILLLIILLVYYSCWSTTNDRLLLI